MARWFLWNLDWNVRIKYSMCNITLYLALSKRHKLIKNFWSKYAKVFRLSLRKDLLVKRRVRDSILRVWGICVWTLPSFSWNLGQFRWELFSWKFIRASALLLQSWGTKFQNLWWIYFGDREKYDSSVWSLVEGEHPPRRRTVWQVTKPMICCKV